MGGRPRAGVSAPSSLSVAAASGRRGPQAGLRLGCTHFPFLAPRGFSGVFPLLLLSLRGPLPRAPACSERAPHPVRTRGAGSGSNGPVSLASGSGSEEFPVLRNQPGLRPGPRDRRSGSTWQSPAAIGEVGGAGADRAALAGGPGCPPAHTLASAGVASGSA